MNNKKGSKIFGFLIKILGKKASIENLKRQAIKAVDTNGDGKPTLEDFANGKWKDIHWGKLAFALFIIVGSIWFGIANWQDVLQAFADGL